MNLGKGFKIEYCNLYKFSVGLKFFQIKVEKEKIININVIDTDPLNTLLLLSLFLKVKYSSFIFLKLLKCKRKARIERG